MQNNNEDKSLFFFNDTATTQIYTLSLHDALPICGGRPGGRVHPRRGGADGARLRPRPGPPGLRHAGAGYPQGGWARDRKSTTLNSSHANILYAVFSLKKIITINCPLSTTRTPFQK